jgi:hypothetical protein
MGSIARTVTLGAGGLALLAAASCTSSPASAPSSSSALMEAGPPSTTLADAATGAMQGATDDSAAPSPPSPMDSGAASLDSSSPPANESGPLADSATPPPATDGAGPATTDSAAVLDSATQTADAAAYVWTNISYGVNGTTFGGGNNIVIVYGGYTATDFDSESLVLELTATRLSALGVGIVYAVRGPEDPDYAAREIGNSELVTAIEPQIAAADHLVIIAHSSGAFVADEFFTEATSTIISKIAYFDLDGGSWALDETLVTSMQGVYFCDAHDSVAGDSANTSSIESLYAEFAGSHLYTVDADGSGCDVGAVWCLHDTLITSRPHNPTTYDLDDDYTDFSGGRHVQTGYIDQAVSDGVL